MAKKPRKSGQPEMLPRNIEISSFSATVRLDATHRKRGGAPYRERTLARAAGHGN